MIAALNSWIRSIMPAQIQIEWGAVMSGVGAIVTYFMGWSDTHEALVVIMSIDYVTGIIAAYVNPHLKLNSKKGFSGFCKKMVILCLVTLSHEIDLALGKAVTQQFVIWFFIANEGLSIIENAAKAGLPIPKKLRDTLEQLATEKGEMKK